MCIVFSSLSILQYYVELDLYTIVMLENLLGTGSFDTMEGHLVHH